MQLALWLGLIGIGLQPFAMTGLVDVAGDWSVLTRHRVNKASKFVSIKRHFTQQLTGHF